MSGHWEGVKNGDGKSSVTVKGMGVERQTYRRRDRDLDCRRKGGNRGESFNLVQHRGAGSIRVTNWRGHSIAGSISKVAEVLAVDKGKKEGIGIGAFITVGLGGMNQFLYGWEKVGYTVGCWRGLGGGSIETH